MKLRYIILLGFSLYLMSCKVGENYYHANLNMPDNFRNDNTVEMVTDTIVHSPHSFFRNRELLTLLDSAFARNSDLLLAVKNIRSAELSLKVAKLNFLPEINAQINGNYTKSSKNSAIGQSGGDRESKDYSLSAGLTWDLDIWGKIRRAKESELAEYLKTKEVHKAVQTKLVLDIAKGYYNLLMLDEQLNVANQSKNLSDSTLFIVKTQYKIGDANLLGLKQVEAQLIENKLLISQIEQSISIQENALSVLCGDYAHKVNRKMALDSEFCNIPLDGYPVSILVARPDVRAAELALRGANARVGVAQAAMYPALKISLTEGLNSITTSNWFSIPASLFGTASGGITQPVFNSGSLKAKYEQAKIEREKAVIVFRQSVIDGYSQVSDAIINKKDIEKQYIFAVDREKALEEGVNSSNILFKAGNINYLDVITVQSNYLQARLQTAQLYINKALSNVQLYYTLGGGWR